MSEALEILPRVEPFATGQTYVIQWIKAALQKSELSDFDKTRLNGASKMPAIVEAIDSLKTVHDQGGVEAAKEAWFKTIAGTVPEIAEIVNQPRRLFHADELEDFKPMRWLVDREIAENGFSVLYGQPGTGKSFQALNYACRVAMRSRPVVYIAAEGGSGYKKRFAAWKQHHDSKGNQKTGPLYFYFDEVHMLDDWQLEHFISEVQFVRPDLIVIDTLARCMGDGDENNTKDMNRFISGVTRLQKELQTAVLVLHHTTKAGTDARGSGALRGAADVMMEMRELDGVFRLSNTKIKDDSAPDVQKYRLEVVTIEQGETSAVLLPALEVKIDPNQLSANQRAILTQLSEPAFDRGARTTELQRASDVSSSSFYSAINSLAKRGLVDKEGRYDPWVLTMTGKNLVRKLRLNQ